MFSLSFLFYISHHLKNMIVDITNIDIEFIILPNTIHQTQHSTIIEFKIIASSFSVKQS